MLEHPENKIGQNADAQKPPLGASLSKGKVAIVATGILLPALVAILGFSPISKTYIIPASNFHDVSSKHDIAAGIGRRFVASTMPVSLANNEDIAGIPMYYAMPEKEYIQPPSEAMNLTHRRYAAAKPWETYRNDKEAKKALPHSPSGQKERQDNQEAGEQQGSGFLVFSEGILNVQTKYGEIPVPRLRDSIEGAEFTPISDSFKSREKENDFGMSFSGQSSVWITEATQAESLLSKALAANSDLSFQECLFNTPVPPAYFATNDASVRYFSASEYREHVEYFADHFKLPTNLVYAIMRTESNFNPQAVSRAKALGLMQVVPESAGGEVHAYLTGVKGIPDAATLLTPEQNIRYGTAYLHLLLTKHFQGIEDPASRELCAIAAYNGGSGSVLRIFDTNKNKAVEKINRMTPGDVYVHLTTAMPYSESRNYVVKVLAAMDDLPIGVSAQSNRDNQLNGSNSSVSASSGDAPTSRGIVSSIDISKLLQKNTIIAENSKRTDNSGIFNHSYTPNIMLDITRSSLVKSTSMLKSIETRTNFKQEFEVDGNI